MFKKLCLLTLLTGISISAQALEKDFYPTLTLTKTTYDPNIILGTVEKKEVLLKVSQQSFEQKSFLVDPNKSLSTPETAGVSFIINYNGIKNDDAIFRITVQQKDVVMKEFIASGILLNTPEVNTKHSTFTVKVKRDKETSGRTTTLKLGDLMNDWSFDNYEFKVENF